MNQKCTCCDEEGGGEFGTQAPTDTAECGSCKRILCLDCLRASALGNQTVTVDKADYLAQEGVAAAFLIKDEDDGPLCPDCYEDQSELGASAQDKCKDFVCDECGIANSERRASRRVEMTACDYCEETFCGDCLRESAIENGLIVRESSKWESNIYASMTYNADFGVLCPKCAVETEAEGDYAAMMAREE